MPEFSIYLIPETVSKLSPGFSLAPPTSVHYTPKAEWTERKGTYHEKFLYRV